MASSLVSLSLLAALFLAAVQATGHDFLPHGDRSLLPNTARLLVGGIDVGPRDPAKPVDAHTCNWSVAEKVRSRLRQITIQPENYAWLGTDSRVSISISQCEGRLPQKDGEDIVALLVSNGKLTAYGQAIQLTLKRNPAVQGKFTGSYAPFSLSNGTLDTSLSHDQKIGVQIKCEIVHCLLGVAPATGGCTDL